MSYNPFSLEGKTILVTGASSGIGQGVAVECSKMNARVIITGRNEERLKQTFDMLEGDGHMQIALDISNIEGVRQLVDSIPVIDGLLNNAGISSAKPISFITENELARLMNINLNAPIHLTNLLIKKNNK